MNLQLADAAQVVGGKLFMMGGCITSMKVPTPYAIAGWLGFEWDETNKAVTLTIDLVDGNGAPVNVDTTLGTKAPWHVDVNLEVGRPPGRRGGRLDMPFAITFSPPILDPGTYTFRLAIKELNASDSLTLQIGQ